MASDNLCPTHQIPLARVEFCPACRGSKGGQVSSPAKTAAARANARKPRTRKVAVCVRCGQRLKRPVKNAFGLIVPGGHKTAALDRTCGRWGFRWVAPQEDQANARKARPGARKPRKEQS